MLNLAFLNQFFYGSRHLLDRNIGINTMLIEQIDSLNFESLKRAFNCLLDVLRTTVKAGFFSIFNVEAELGSNDNLVLVGRECFTYEFLVREWA